MGSTETSGAGWGRGQRRQKRAEAGGSREGSRGEKGAKHEMREGEEGGGGVLVAVVAVASSKFRTEAALWTATATLW